MPKQSKKRDLKRKPIPEDRSPIVLASFALKKAAKEYAAMVLDSEELDWEYQLERTQELHDAAIGYVRSLSDAPRRARSRR